jgi:hypothetical protein
MLDKANMTVRGWMPPEIDPLRAAAALSPSQIHKISTWLCKQNLKQSIDLRCEFGTCDWLYAPEKH